MMATSLSSLIVFLFSVWKVQVNFTKIKKAWSSLHSPCSLHGFALMHWKEIWIYVFPGKEMRGLSPNFHIHVSVSDLNIPTIGPPIFLQQNRNWDWGRAVPFLEIFVSVLCLCSVRNWSMMILTLFCWIFRTKYAGKACRDHPYTCGFLYLVCWIYQQQQLS
jgi:hypothetical protein